MTFRIHDPGAAVLAAASSATPILGLGPDTWKWIASLVVSIAGVIAAVVIHIQGQTADARRRQELLDLEQRILKASLEKAGERVLAAVLTPDSR
jgi:hypothetical protein